MSFFRAESNPIDRAQTYKSAALRDAESFKASHKTCMSCKRHPSAILMTRGDKRITLCQYCAARFNAPAPAVAARDRAERLRAMTARLRGQGLI